MNQSESQQHTALQQVVAKALRLGGAGLVRAELGPLSFERKSDALARLHSLVMKISAIDFQDLPDTFRDTFYSSVAKITSLFESLLQFDPDADKASAFNYRDNLASQIVQTENECFQLVIPILTHYEMNRFVRNVNEKLSSSEAEEYKQQISELAKQLENEIAEVRRIRLEQAEYSKNSGLSAHATHFSEEAKEHEKSAFRWLVATSVASALTISVSALFYSYLVNNAADSKNEGSLQIAIARVAIVSAFLTGALWCGKLYRNHRHNCVVNRHRANALSTLQSFANASLDEQTKNAVLLQATSCIFNPQPTGYVTSETDGSTNAQVLEIWRSASKSS